MSSPVMNDQNEGQDDQDVEVLDDRVAGHPFKDGVKAGIAREKTTGLILKLMDGDIRGTRELEFYKKLYDDHLTGNCDENDTCSDCIIQIKNLRQFCPLFYGTRVIRNRTFMRLENISVGAKGVMDVKIGSVTWDRFASKEKVLAEKSKYPWREELSFRILGFRVKDQKDQLHLLTKDESKSLSPDRIPEKIQLFLSPDDDVTQRDKRKQLFLLQLNQIYQMMQRQTYHQFISSSLLMVYGSPDDHDSGEEKVTVKMIDFAHTFQNDKRRNDENYLNGLKSFIEYFSKS